MESGDILGEQLPAADGPQVKLVLPDGQELYAVVRRRRLEPGPGDGGWWYLVSVPLWGAARLSDGRVLAEPVPVEVWAPAHVCTPLAGQDYGEVPTDRPDRTPRWLLEEATVGGEGNDVLVVHRGDCAAPAGTTRAAAAEAVRRAAAPCRARRAGRLPRVGEFWRTAGGADGCGRRCRYG
ncbi:hypothetical protein [Streptomyces litchfieldiae]|uniref:Uncharacterized protein n=1 Tax=Streptomyces litchfieldiae TaxID=3075543 RepID=A0ABU2N2N5_9ACTN|nr:hypothetical protein [Streptomyces sp. DSM 44938]MDT0347564.1 hypothetical protein [Streptomyces sp. DSM 44938]